MPIDAGHDLATSGTSAMTEARAAELASSLFGIRGRAQRLDGEYDDNFHVTTGTGDGGWVFKLSHAGEDPAVIDLQHEAIRRAGFGEARVAIADIDGNRRYARLLPWIPGELLAKVQ